MTGPKFKGNPAPPPREEYEYVSIAFFGDDKRDMVEVLNEAKLPYTSLSHFVRAAINTQMKQHGIDFHITER